MAAKIPAANLDELLRFLQSPAGSDVDWTRLPTFGGDEPRDTSGIWSWDERRILRGTCATDIRIVPRPRELFLIRVSEYEREQIKKAAKRAGLPASTWARDLLLRAARS